MGNQTRGAGISALAEALKEATVDDLEFAEQPLSTHGEVGETKIGCRPVAVRSVPVPNPTLIVYVRARDAKGNYWYVIDWSQADAARRPREVLASSENEAKEVVLTGLRLAVAREMDHEP